ncbi:unnamed protein product [Adineta ricciae]|uniref:Transmembrane protein n=1 Tax=Adineta ricciae TaxID=249248 RepID=A0A813XL58_ADIRI|nr:unnamed protein product [Adineta ricciae]
MKISVLVTLIVLPMLTSIGLYFYAFLNTRWSYLDEDLIDQHSLLQERQRVQSNDVPNRLPLQMKPTRYVFRSYYGLFGYCLDFRWINLLTPKLAPTASEQQFRTNSTLTCQRCHDPKNQCPGTDCCMVRCNNIPDCPSYYDEKDCNRPYNQTRYYWPQGNCMWQSTWLGNHELQSYLSSYETSPQGSHYYTKRIRYFVMFLLFLAAPLLTFLALLILFCISCVERFYSIPFAFVSFMSLASFLSGTGALGIFLYEWVHERFYRPDYTYEFKDDALIRSLNPWLIQVERFGLPFWLIIAAVGATLFTTILSCCFCCGLQSEKSKLRFHVDNDVYEIVQMTPYDE